MIAKISLILSTLLTAAVAYLFVTQKKDTSDENIPKAETAPALQTEGGPKPVVLAYVNGDSLNAHYKFIVEKKKQLEVKMKEAEKRVEKEYREREKQVEVWKSYMKSNKLSKEEEQTMQEDIMRYEQELAEIEEREMGALKKEEARLQSDLLKKVNTFLAKFSKQHGIDYVINQQDELQLILYGNNAYNITAQVIEGLNAEYTQENKD